tara:strand:- start:1284 stop:2456 length:1173 start_codon:yes stop_codon:yes gene_type:complete
MNFLNTRYFKIYISSIFILGIFFLSKKFLYPTDWTTSEWLINYQGGFVRRGFVGEFLFYIGNFIDLPLRYLVFVFEIIVYGLFLYFTYSFFNKQKLHYVLFIIFFSPVFLIYPLAENEILIRKEFLLFIFFIIYINKLINDKSFYLYLSVTLPILNLIWDGIIFYLFFIFFLFLTKKNLNKKECFKFFISFIPYFISLVLIINTKSNPAGFELMCLSIKEECFGAMLALDKSLMWNINYQVSRFDISYLARYVFLIIIIFAPFFFIKSKNNASLNIAGFKISKNLYLYTLYILTILSILIFMIIGFDWGRWISIGYVMLTFTIFYLIKIDFINIENSSIKSIDKYFDNNRKIFYVFCFSYCFTWNMKATMTDDIGSLPYIRIINKLLDYL